jgi:hypothetical protein
MPATAVSQSTQTAPLPSMVKLAHEIAEEQCELELDCYLAAVRDRRGRLLWYDLNSADEHSRWFIQRAVRYLDMRGLLRRHPHQPNYVNWRRA